jgi:predicted phage terminase large subunit-like protein
MSIRLENIQFSPELEIDLIRSVTKDSFYRFVQEFWGTIITEKPVWNWHIKYLCDEAQIVAERIFAGQPKLYDLIINISPGSTKSSLFSVFMPAWMWTRMPNARLICCSYSATLAGDFSRKNREVIRSEKYQKCFPEIKLKMEKADHFDNTSHGERYSAGVGGSVTGKHTNCIVLDDPINPTEAASEAGVRAANMWLHETITTRTANAKTTPTIMIMQRLHQDDPTGDWIANAKPGSYKHICLPADCSEGQTVLPEEFKENYVDGLFDPVRLPRDILDQRRMWMGEYGYACQYDQHPIPRSGGKFLTHAIRIGHVDPSDPVVFTVRYWDKAISTKKTACFTVGAKIGKTRMGKYYVLDIVRGRWDSATRERIIRTTAELDGRRVIIGIEQEPGSGGMESALNTVRNLDGFTCKVDKVDTNKDTRADPFSTQVNAYNVTLVPGAWNTEYLSELQFFPNSKFKDQVDASSGAFNLIANMSRRVAGGWS